ncbi:MAG: CD3072 family TudS-related putative desulfidase [Cellulosilyticaceae bacterium]
MGKIKIVFISHCVLNAASKVMREEQRNMITEDGVRKNFICEGIKQGVQFVQLPCPEFSMYGCNRWGHTKEQFDNPFFKSHCRKILEPYILQMQEYVSNPTKFEVIGIVGIDGSPSCGINRTCSGQWGGEFSRRNDLDEVIQSLHVSRQKGVFMEVLETMMKENNIDLPMSGLKEGVRKIVGIA